MNLVNKYNELQSVDELSKLVGKELLFYGVDGCYFKLNNTIWEAVENPDDGYRSYLGSIERVYSNQIFFRTPLAYVKLIEVSNGNFEGWSLVDVADGHVWLDIGTDNYDDYYPTFVFSYNPKAPVLQ